MITGIFGGTFNPIHNGHVALARTLLDGAGLDEVWFVVSPQNPWKQNHALLDDEKRLEMVQAALEGEACMTASDYEFRLPRPSYMWHTLQSMSRDYPDREFVLLIGGDNWDGFDRWYHYEDILANYRVVVYPRANAGGETTPSATVIASTAAGETSPSPSFALPSVKGVTLLDTPLLDISSTEVRRLIGEGQPFEHLVPFGAAAIIRRDNLYL